MQQAAALAAGAVDRDRLWQRHMEMARIGATPAGGVNRQALSAEDIGARRQLIAWAVARGFTIAVDGIGNLFVRRPGVEPQADPVVTGSHMDSQPKGGRFDGMYGVLAGLEALEALEDAGIATRRPIDLVAWTNEEGGRFAPGAMGSAVFTGQMPLSKALAKTDGDGVTLAEALAETLAATPEAGDRPFGFPIAAYVEAHIEQGPRLEQERKTIGVVTGIQGSRWFEVEVTGEEAHAGTTPLKARKDAVSAAVAMIAALERHMADPADTVRFTVGRVNVTPNTPNTVPSRVLFSIDFRHPDAGVLKRLGDGIEQVCRAHAKGCPVKMRETFNKPPCDFAPRIVELVEATVREMQLPYLVMPSGAFHDAQFLNDRTPTGMIFIPCWRGLSHNEAENATPDDCAAGARVLTAVLAELAEAV